ncbi:MAG: class I SAM-dependent methyltransferase [Oscillochloris sp.]|nr:class I SAM-dependent methyltransferase [Oscillochloris sp.]
MNTYDPFARYYDADFRGYTEDVPFYREMSRRANGPILELMCGTGRVLIPLAEAGHPMTGVDTSPAMLAIARQHLDEAELFANLIEGDVRNIDLPEQTYGLAFVAINSFMHLETVRDQLAALATARRALTRRGTLVIDLFNPDPIEIARENNQLVIDRFYELDGRQVQKFVAIDSDAATQTSHVTYLYDETGAEGQVSRRTMRFVMRWFYRYEIEHLLARAGFTLRAIYGTYELDEYVTGSPRMIVVASPVK